MLLRLCAVLQTKAQVLRLPGALGQKRCSDSQSSLNREGVRISTKGGGRSRSGRGADRCERTAAEVGSKRGKDGMQGSQEQLGASSDIGTRWNISAMQNHHSQDKEAASFTGTPRD